MIKEYDLKLYTDTSTADSVLYEMYVDRIGQLLIDCGLFDDVVITKPQSSGTYSDYYVEGKIENNTVVKFSLVAAPVTYTSASRKVLNGQKFTVFYDNGVSSREAVLSTTMQGTSSQGQYGCSKAHVTSNGVIIQAYLYGTGSSATWGSIVIARSNKDYPLITFPEFDSYNNARSSVLACHTISIASVCFPEPSYYVSGRTLNNSAAQYFYNATAKQTLMFPFAGYASINGDRMYSKYSFWIPFAPASLRNSAFQKVQVNGKQYVIDGYFALRDD